MNQIGSRQISIEQMTDGYLKHKQVRSENTESSQAFGQILLHKQMQFEESRAEGGITFSKHANERLNLRNIELDESQMERLQEGIEHVRSKIIQHNQ